MTFPLATLGAVVGPTGISAPSYADILTSLQASFKVIYGQDVYLGSDTQDGQLLAVFAQAIYDANSAAIAVYNQFSPATAQGAGLSSMVKINGIARNIASNSQVIVTLGGVVGTVISNGTVTDINGNVWALPASVTIPAGSTINVLATCTALGAIAAAPHTVNSISTPTLGWSSVDNLTAASLGAAVETDAQLRQRQTQSVGLPALTVLASTLAAIKAIVGVTEAVVYENDTGIVDANGLPAHSIAAVVTGGDPVAICTAIMNKKTPGCYTYGTSSQNVTDSAGVVHTIRYFVPTNTPIKVAITIKALNGYVSATGDALKQSVVDYINNTLNIGDPVYIARLYLPAQLNGGPGFSQYELQQLLISISPASPGPLDITIPFNGQATCQLSDVALTVV